MARFALRYGVVDLDHPHRCPTHLGQLRQLIPRDPDSTLLGEGLEPFMDGDLRAPAQELELWDAIFYKPSSRLGLLSPTTVAPSALVTLASSASQRTLDTVGQLLFEQYLVPSAWVTSAPLAAAAALANSLSAATAPHSQEPRPPETALVIDVGARSSRVMPVWNGSPLWFAHQLLPGGGAVLTRRWAQALSAAEEGAPSPGPTSAAPLPDSEPSPFQGSSIPIWLARSTKHTLSAASLAPSADAHHVEAALDTYRRWHHYALTTTHESTPIPPISRWLAAMVLSSTDAGSALSSTPEFRYYAFSKSKLKRPWASRKRQDSQQQAEGALAPLQLPKLKLTTHLCAVDPAPPNLDVLRMSGPRGAPELEKARHALAYRLYSQDTVPAASQEAPKVAAKQRRSLRVFWLAPERFLIPETLVAGPNGLVQAVKAALAAVPPALRGPLAQHIVLSGATFHIHNLPLRLAQALRVEEGLGTDAPPNSTATVHSLPWPAWTPWCGATYLATSPRYSTCATTPDEWHEQGLLILERRFRA